MRILFLGAYKSPDFNLRYGDPRDPALGGQRKMALLMRALLLGGHEVQVVSSAVGWRQAWGWQKVPFCRQEFPEGNVDIYHATTVCRKPWGGLLICLTAARTARALAHSWAPDILFAYNSLIPEAYTIAAVHSQNPVPVVLEIDDLPSVRGSIFHPKAIIDRLASKPTAKRASGFVFVNEQIRRRFATESRPDLVLPGVVEKDLLLLAAKRRAPFTGSRRKLLYAGGLSVERGAHVLLDAIPTLPKGWQIAVAGAGTLAESFRALAASDPDRCSYLGLLSSESLYRNLCEADAVINTPEQLNDNSGVFPFKIFEYLACGAHVISTPLPEVTGQDLKWFQRWSGSAADLSTVLLRAESDFSLERTLRADSHQWIERKFSLEAAALSLASLFKEIHK